MCRSILLAASLALGLTGCSCGESAARPDGPAARDAGPDVREPDDARGPDAAQSDACTSDPAHPEEAWACALDVPWSADGTRQLTPIEIPPVVSATECGPACRQVTFLPGFRMCTGRWDFFSVDGDFLTTSMYFDEWGGDVKRHRCLQVYVDLRTLKAYAFGAILSGASYTACNGTTNAGRVGYACGGYPTGGPEPRAELRVFDIGTRTERLLWSASTVAEDDQPSSLALAGENLATVMRPGCPSCNTLFLSPLSGGPRRQVYPAEGEPPGGIDGVVSSPPYLVLADAQRYFPAGKAVEVVAIDLRQPAQPIDVSDHAADQWNARISGTRVVWMDTRNDPSHDAWNYQNTDIYVKDLASGEERAICTDPAGQDSPDIEGDVVVWMDCRNLSNPTPGPSGGACPDPYVMRLWDGVEHKVEVTLAGQRGRLRINGGRLFFDGRPEGEAYDQVYMIDLRELGLVP